LSKLLWLGRAVAGLIWAFALVMLAALCLAWQDQSATALTPYWLYYGALLGGTALAIVVHELAHLVACLALGVPVRAFRLGRQPAPIRFRVRKVHVGLNWASHGLVEHCGTSSAWRLAVITLAGSLADLLVAAALAGLPLLAPGLAVTGRLAAWAVALVFAAIGLANLVPFRTRKGQLSDGARLLLARADASAAEVSRASREAFRLQASQRAPELLRLHAALAIPDGPLSVAQATAILQVEWSTVGLPGLPSDAAELAQRRAELLAGQPGLGSALTLTLAAVRLHLGRFSEVEPLCDALPAHSPSKAQAVMALAMTALARQALGQPTRGLLAAKPSLSRCGGRDPSALEWDVETQAGRWKWIADPAGTLAAFRRGDREARLGADAIATWLRRQGRTDDLLALHEGFKLVPDDPNLRQFLVALHVIEYNVVLVPGMPADVIDAAARRLEFALDKFPCSDADHPQLRLSMLHSLAVARLRQGRFREVRPLCLPGLAKDIAPEERATVLATVVLAARGLRAAGAGQGRLSRRLRRMLAEAVALAPDADLVAEAAGVPLPLPVPVTA
jgi:hypothetical protein